MITSWLAEYHLLGLTIGLSTFLVIGLFHPLVIKAEYYLGQPSRYLFAGAGVITLAAAVLVLDVFWSSILGVVGFSCFWSILEISEQKRRIERGWFPPNPRHLERYDFDEGVNPGQNQDDNK